MLRIDIRNVQMKIAINQKIYIFLPSLKDNLNKKISLTFIKAYFTRS